MISIFRFNKGGLDKSSPYINKGGLDESSPYINIGGLDKSSPCRKKKMGMMNQVSTELTIIPGGIK
ncbi:MAG: hypothetical protein GTN73_02815 [Candidatus Aminicenantes bacterium]|nr:hypothetical protein [Candidatus Aminicenantes bacterium]